MSGNAVRVRVARRHVPRKIRHELYPPARCWGDAATELRGLVALRILVGPQAQAAAYEPRRFSLRAIGQGDSRRRTITE